MTCGLRVAWGEDLAQLLAAVRKCIKEQNIPENAAIWFCVFRCADCQQLSVE